MLYNETLCYNDLSVWLPDGSLNNSAVDLSCFVTDSANYNPKDYVWIVAFGAVRVFRSLLLFLKSPPRFARSSWPTALVPTTSPTPLPRLSAPRPSSCGRFVLSLSLSL